MKDKLPELYLPSKAKVISVADMTSDVKLFRVTPEKPFGYKPGQFLMISLWGAGEIPISITSTHGIQECLELCIKRVGHVTTALHSIKAEDEIGIRGPFGNSFRPGDAKGRDILFIAGGIGISPLRALINYVLKNKKDYKKVELVYGSKSPADMLFMDDIREWRKAGMNVVLTVDRGDGRWKGNKGIVTEHTGRSKVSFKKAYAFVCGPNVMIKAAIKDLSEKGMPEENIITTLEAHMKCGVGKCGHCYAGGKYICTDGPVFSYKEIKQGSLCGP